MNKLPVFIIFILVSCNSKWENTPTNKFLAECIIDTTKYNTYEELFLNGKIKRIITTDSHATYTHFATPIVTEDKFIFIEKKYYQDIGKNVIIKIDKNGETVDSIIINKNSAIINDYIIDKNSYCSWFINNDKNMKNLENVNFFSKSDTTKITALVKTLNKNKVQFFSTSGYSNENSIDTCNYIISFISNKLIKYNYLKSIGPEYDLQIKSIISSKFSTKFRNIKSINSENLFKVDNFYAYSLDKLIRRGISGSDFFSNTGTSISYCNSYDGTYFITLLNQSNLKLKLMNKQICENRSIHEFAKKNDVFTEDFLNFYLIDIHGFYFDVPLYYVVKK